MNNKGTTSNDNQEEPLSMRRRQAFKTLDTAAAAAATMGIMDYGLMYRLFGATPSEMLDLLGKKRPNVLEVYAGARSIWLRASIKFSSSSRLIERTPTVGASYTSPIIGGRIMVDFSPHWFVVMDGNVGGFGAEPGT
jgi:hypothetical protein